MGYRASICTERYHILYVSECMVATSRLSWHLEHSGTHGRYIIHVDTYQLHDRGTCFKHLIGSNLG